MHRTLIILIPTRHRASTRTRWLFAFGLCCHSNEIPKPIANLPNSAQLGGPPYHSPKLHQDPCSSGGMRRGRDTQTRVTNIHFASSTTDAKYNDNVSGAVITARVHAIHLMNADWTPDGRQPSNQANRLGLWVLRYAAIIHIHHRHLLVLLSPKTDTHFTVPRRVEGPRHCNKGAQPVPKAVYRSGCRDKKNNWPIKPLF